MTQRLRRGIAALALIAMLPMAGVLCAGECNRAVQHQTTSDTQACHDADTVASSKVVSGNPDRCSPFASREVATRERVAAPAGSQLSAELVITAREAQTVSRAFVETKRHVFERALPPGTVRPLRI